MFLQLLFANTTIYQEIKDFAKHKKIGKYSRIWIH